MITQKKDISLSFLIHDWNSKSFKEAASEGILYTKVSLKILQNSQENHLCQRFFFNKVADLNNFFTEHLLKTASGFKCICFSYKQNFWFWITLILLTTFILFCKDAFLFHLIIVGTIDFFFVILCLTSIYNIYNIRNLAIVI